MKHESSAGSSSDNTLIMFAAFGSEGSSSCIWEDECVLGDFVPSTSSFGFEAAAFLLPRFKRVDGTSRPDSVSLSILM
jgi:hypothetical protein